MIFGNQNDNKDEDAQSSASSGSFIVGADSSNPIASDAPLPTDLDDTSDSSGTLDQSAASTVDDSQAASLDDNVPAVGGDTDSYTSVVAPADRDIPAVVHASADDQSVSSDDRGLSPITPLSDDLLELKQQALNDLSPLVDHLDQTPEEKFRTTMMLIQSTDNSSLIKDAYAAAHEITDEKIRAQALLDVVNEINYFTQQAANGQA